MSSIPNVGSGSSPIVSGAAAPAAATGSSGTATTTFNAMDFLDKTGSSTASTNTQRLRALGLPPAKDDNGRVGTDGTDLPSLQPTIGQSFDLTEVSTIFLEFMLAHRQAARIDRQSALQAQVSELLSSAQQTKDAADAEYSKALVQGIASIVGGAIQGAVGAMQLRSLSSMKANLAERQALDPSGASANPRSATRLSESLDVTAGDAAKAANRTSAKAAPALLEQIETIEKGSPSLSVSANRQSTNLSSNEKLLSDKFQMLTTRNQLLNTAGQAGKSLVVDTPSSILAGQYEKDAGYSRSEGQIHEAQAKKAEAVFSSANDEAQTARDAFNKVLDMVAEIERSRSEASKSIARI